VPWTNEELEKLIHGMVQYGSFANWLTLQSAVGTKNARQCREKWYEICDRKIVTGQLLWTETMDKQLLRMRQEKFGRYTISSLLDVINPCAVKDRWIFLMKRAGKLRANSAPLPVPTLKKPAKQEEEEEEEEPLECLFDKGIPNEEEWFHPTDDE
jgi:hypothetical protein